MSVTQEDFKNTVMQVLISRALLRGYAFPVASKELKEDIEICNVRACEILGIDLDLEVVGEE